MLPTQKVSANKNILANDEQAYFALIWDISSLWDFSLCSKFGMRLFSTSQIDKKKKNFKH